MIGSDMKKEKEAIKQWLYWRLTFMRDWSIWPQFMLDILDAIRFSNIIYPEGYLVKYLKDDDYE